MRKLKFLLLISYLLILAITLANCGGTTEPEDGNFPQNLLVEKLSNFSVKLTWEYEETDSDTIFFQIAKKTGASGWLDSYAEVDGETFEFIDYIPTTDSLVYAYKIKVYNASLGTLTQFSESVAYLSENTFPTDFAFVQINQEVLQVSWNDHCIGEEGYVVDKKINDGSWENGYILLQSDADNFTDTVTLFDSISYRIYAYVGTTQTDDLIDTYFATLLAPANLSTSIPDQNKIRLNWEDNSTGEDGFYVEKKVGDQQWDIQYASVDSNITTYVDDNLLPCATLQYRVQAYKGEFYSSYSNIDTLNVNLEELSSYSTPGSALEVTLPVGNAYIPEWTAFIADDYQGLAIIDCHNPSSPQSIVTYQDLWGDRTLSSYVSGNFLYITTRSLADAEGGIQKVDITSYENPVISNVTATTGIPKDLFVEEDFAYLAEGEAGMSVMYVASSYPVFIANIDLFDARSIKVFSRNADNYAVIANGLNGGIVIIDITDPYNPVQISSLPLNGLANDVFVQDDFIYLANGENGLAIIDITNPANPILFNEVQTQGFVNGVYAENNYVYITDIEKGFFVINIEDPQGAFIQGSLMMDTQPVSVHLSVNYAYVTDNQGLKIIKIKP